jgi:hypothetical protein
VDKTVHKKIEVLAKCKKDIFIALQNMQQWMIGGEKMCLILMNVFYVCYIAEIATD